MSIYIKLNRGKELIAAGYSVFVVDEKKQPMHRWKDRQTTAFTDAELEKDIAKPNAWRYGYATGFCRPVHG
jgi:hypothetical protein